MLITDEKTIDDYYQALLNRTSSYVGIFYVGVKTTSVFCIATCRARKPKRQNVEFYTSFKEALANGYRPCKICKPTENANCAPAPVEAAIQLVKDNPKLKITDHQLKQQAISPELVRRWFNKNYGMTFQAFGRMYRINNALIELKSGRNTTDTAFDSGYESLSGFGYSYKKLLGESPSSSEENAIILISRLTTPLGPMFVCASDLGVCLLEFVDRVKLESEFKDLQQRLRANIIAGENMHIKLAKEQLAEYFSGQRRSFTFQLHASGSAFQKIVWKKLQGIECGKICSYQQLAIDIDNTNAVRAVAAANAANRIAIVVPCHRVIAKNGKLTGYGGGLERKAWLLEHEQNMDL